MLAVILKILSILGIILLILLGVVLFLLLLVLFMPIVYKVDASKSDTEMTANVRARWLFGFMRANYSYPAPGNIIVKVLWKTVFDSAKKSEKTEDTIAENKADERNDVANKHPEEQQDVDNSSVDNSSVDNSLIDTTDTANDTGTPPTTEKVPSKEQTDSESERPVENESKSLKDKLFAKYEKIKYTIQQFYDKIKHIWQNITFYKKLLQDEQTKLLVSHVFRRLGKILRHIRPRKLKADVIFGTGSPDTTGYAYGIYGMFSPQLGKNVFVTPDFTQKILVGNVHAAGHITIFTLLINVLAVLLDRRLRILIRRLKNHSAKQKKQSNL